MGVANLALGHRSPHLNAPSAICPSQQKTNYQRVLEHNGAHILFDESLKPADQPCGLCLRPFPMCTFLFQKCSGTAAARQIDWKISTCLNPLNFQMSAAMKSSEKSPCSNHLIECPLQCGVVLWTYNLTAHYNSYHALKSLSNIPAVYPTSPAPSPIGNSPDAVAVNSPATSTPELSALRPRTKKKAAKVECICGKEVTNDQRESDAFKCIRTGCETIWVRGLF
ncbi:hypothetical protein DFH08DRAFT_711958 [Mycena albidolilacea]|uniref:Uncharacterized protein n=1 Tax=Mycena albidolilacea TaxID=1033008 RepID=A0AAD6ZHM9_9AGAR|nr:hypothetical protein DFH08DRAFT_711958 [Mycena albidolilacea]